MKPQAGRDDFGRLPRALLGLMLPPGRRDEFIGDLLEEARQREARGGSFNANRWLWHQVLRSCPSLLVARLRRIPVAHAVAVPAAAVGQGMFAGFLLGGQRRSWRAWALGVSVLIHATLLVGAAVRGMWGVEELSPPRVVIKFWQDFLPAPPDFAKPAAAAEKKSVRPGPRPDRGPRARPSNTPVPVAFTRADTPPGEPSKSEAIDDRQGNPQAGCPPGASCEGAAESPQFLPPQVGDKSCTSCPLPRLPPAFTRIGTVHDMLIRICVGADGQVASVRVLRGISAAADQSVVATVATWRFSPYRIGDRPVPFCYPTRFLFSSQ